MWISLVIEKLFFNQNKNQHKGSFSQQRCRGGFVDQIRQEFNFSNVCEAKNYGLNGTAMILVISPLKSIIEDQLQQMELLGYHAKDLANLSDNDIRQCNFKIVFATTEKVKEPFQAMLMDSKSKLHQNISHDRDMNQKKIESSNLFLKLPKIFV